VGITTNRRDQTDAEIKAFENELRSRSQNSFFPNGHTTRKSEIGQEIVTLNKQLAEIAERRYKAGDVSELDYNLILVRWVAQVRNNLDLNLN